MYDPVELSRITETIVTKGELRKYYRFRAAGFYGGISTADTVGCNLRCKFCWSGNSVWNAKITGNFYSPEDVANILEEIARKKGYKLVRVSGGEPTIGKEHLIKLLSKISDDFIFILETNGILLGYDEKYVDQLSRFKNLHVRVCFKGCNAEEFTWLTGASRGFEYQLKALEYLRDKGLNFNIAVVSVRGNKLDFYKKLKEMDLGKLMVEEEKIKLYPRVEERLKREGIIDYFR